MHFLLSEQDGFTTEFILLYVPAEAAVWLP